MDLCCLTAELAALEGDASLSDERCLSAREAALDWLDLARQWLRANLGCDASTCLVERISVVESRLVAVNGALFSRVRADLREHGLSRQKLRRLLESFAGHPTARHVRYLGYDGLDALVSGVLHPEPLPEPTRALEPEMVHYEQTPARAILELVERVPLDESDLFYDLGAGLGRIVMMVHLLTGVEARGVEIEPAYVAYARRCAERLALTGVRFVCGDARTADYRDGTVFFMFAPFVGAMLATVLRRLESIAQGYEITLCTYGPITPTVARETWLLSEDPDLEDEYRLVVFRSR